MAQDRPKVTYTLDGVVHEGEILRGSVGGILIKGVSPEMEALVHLKFTCGSTDQKSIEGLGRVKRMRDDGGDEVFPVKLLRIVSREGLVPLKEFLRDWLAVEFSEVDPSQVVRIGTLWMILCAPEDPDAPIERFPQMKPEDLAPFFSPDDGEKIIHLYLRTSVVYLINRMSYGGRAVRMTQTLLTVQTNMLLPALGNPIQVQFSIPDEDGSDHLVVLSGSVSRRSDQKEDVGWKGRFEVLIRGVEELETSGTFLPFLERLWAEASE